MTIKVNFTSLTQGLVKPQDRHLGLNLRKTNADQGLNGHIQSKDLFTLTDTVSNLKKLVGSSANSPFIDVTRVIEIKRTIEDGGKIFDSTRVAQKLMQFERALQ